MIITTFNLCLPLWLHISTIRCLPLLNQTMRSHSFDFNSPLSTSEKRKVLAGKCWDGELHCTFPSSAVTMKQMGSIGVPSLALSPQVFLCRQYWRLSRVFDSIKDFLITFTVIQFDERRGIAKDFIVKRKIAQLLERKKNLKTLFRVFPERLDAIAPTLINSIEATIGADENEINWNLFTSSSIQFNQWKKNAAAGNQCRLENLNQSGLIKTPWRWTIMRK